MAFYGKDTVYRESHTSVTCWLPYISWHSFINTVHQHSKSEENSKAIHVYQPSQTSHAIHVNNYLSCHTSLLFMDTLRKGNVASKWECILMLCHIFFIPPQVQGSKKQRRALRQSAA